MAKIKEKQDPGIPAGAIPQVVNQRVFDYLPVLYQALEAIHKELVEMKEILKKEK